MRRLRRGGWGAAGVRTRDRSVLACGVGRILHVFFFIFAMKRVCLHDEGVLGEEAGTMSATWSASIVGLCFGRREYVLGKLGTNGDGRAP